MAGGAGGLQEMRATYDGLADDRDLKSLPIPNRGYFWHGRKTGSRLEVFRLTLQSCVDFTVVSK